MASDRKNAIVSCLCKCLSLDPKNFTGDFEKSDVKTLCTNIFKSSENGSSLLSNDEVMKWVEFAEDFPVDFEACHGAINGLNVELVSKSVLVGNGLKLSEVDTIVYSLIHSLVSDMSKSDRQKFPHVLRWIDYFQNKVDLGEMLEKIPVEKTQFDPQAYKKPPLRKDKTSKDAAKEVKDDAKTKDMAKGSKTANGTEAEKSLKKDSTSKAKVDKAATEVKKSEKDAASKDEVPGNKPATEVKQPEKEAVPKDEISVSLLNIQVGLIRKAWKHSSADSLLIEEIDVGEPKVRQVVSGLAKFCSPDDLMNRHVVLITNVKPGKLRDVVSQGLLLCASNENHSVVEPLRPPEGATVGERVLFAGHDGKPEVVLNPKKKQLDKITPHLFTDENGVATYKGIPFMTSAGPCSSSFPRASIK